MRIAGLELEAKSLAGSIAVVIGEFEYDVDPVVLIPENFDPLLIRARVVRADIEHEQQENGVPLRYVACVFFCGPRRLFVRRAFPLATLVI